MPEYIFDGKRLKKGSGQKAREEHQDAHDKKVFDFVKK
jgi:hypothetical protein